MGGLTDERNDAGRLVLRLTMGVLMLLHGIDKLHGGIAGIQRTLARHDLPEAFGYGVYVGEVLAPLLLIVGFKTRTAAAVFSFNMVIAILLSHADGIFRLGKSGQWAIELQMLYLLGGACIVLLGAGRYSIDARRQR